MKKFGFLSRLMLTAALMTLIWLFADCREVYAGLEKIECVVYEIEICSICGHNYNDIELCSHQKGITYNSKECKPYEEKYCNICGQNMIYCEHVEGVEYGGTECKPWERCNICGNNYYDPNGACSHWEGEIYGGTECSTYIIEVCNICGKNYHGGDCPHHEGAWYDEGYCELEDMTVCNICGNNYYDPNGACSHWEGEIYGGIECSTTTICNICGNNYYDPNGACSHWEGNRYGGTVCEASSITLCNICGNNYYDPNGACPHWEGNEYGGETCNTSVKRICNVCNDLYLNCLHIAGHEYENVVYYYYIEDRKDQAEIDALDLETIRDDISNPYNYKNKISKVVKVPMNTNDEFKAAWNGIGTGEQQYYCIYALIMNMHGNATEISNGPGKGYSMRLNMEDIRALERKPVQRLLLLQCNVGSIDHIGNNAASAFAEKVTGKVLAGDGEVHIHTIYESEVGEKKPNVFFSSEEGIYMQYEARKKGWSFYQYDRDRERVICTQTDKNWLRIYQLIDMF